MVTTQHTGRMEEQEFQRHSKMAQMTGGRWERHKAGVLAASGVAGERDRRTWKAPKGVSWVDPSFPTKKPSQDRRKEKDGRGVGFGGKKLRR